MKLNKTLGILSTLSLGIIPTLTKADLFQCLACPAGTYGNGTSTSCTPCKTGTYAPSGSSSCKACPTGQYQNETGQGSCKACPTGQIVNASKTGCINIGDFTLDKFTQIASGNKSGTLQSGWYLIRLRGGSGGYGCYTHHSNDSAYASYRSNSGSLGGVLNYVFFLPETASYYLTLGNNGSNAVGYSSYGPCQWTNISNSYGKGGSSSSLIVSFSGKNYPFVAGGGGGGYGYYSGSGSSDKPKCQNGGDAYCNVSGNLLYEDGTTKLINNISCGGSGDKVIYCGAPFKYESGTSGTSSHTSNVPKIPSCGSSCAILYKLK